MSDLEDIVLLDDIKALEGALAQKEKVVEFPASEVAPKSYIAEPNLNITGNSTVDDDESRTDEQGSDFSSEEDNDDSDTIIQPVSTETALNMNKKLIHYLRTAKNKLTSILEKCRKNQITVEKKIERCGKKWPFNRGMTLNTAGIPYFKDEKHFPAPMNEDAKEQIAKGVLRMKDLPRVFRWTPKDRSMLLKSIRWNAAEVLADELLHKELREKQGTEASKDALGSLDPLVRQEKISELLLLDLSELVGHLGDKEFDWLKMATMDFDGRHSESECRVMWNVFLHPAINKCKWTKAEDSKLKELAEKFDFQNWDAIASELQTKRTGYQCFIRFNTSSNKITTKGSSWSKEEDLKLEEVVRKLRIGNFIPWGEVAINMEGRTKQQAYYRWTYSLAPHLKKGRFTKEEDKMLRDAMAKYGTNFAKISATLMPHRTTAQLNDHYHTLIKEKLNIWSLEDDKKLMHLHEKHGKNWAHIAREFPNKTRVQVRHRYSSIIRFEKKGTALKNMPRARDDQFTLPKNRTNLYRTLSRSKATRPTPRPATKKQEQPINQELTEYFQRLYHTPSRPGRVKKCYTQNELDDKTQKLHAILQILNADLDIPEDYEDAAQLTEKDKQLLSSLMSYTQIKNQAANNRWEIVESTRIQMFGQQKFWTSEHYVPPLPFGMQVRTKRKIKEPKGIDYNIDIHKVFLADVEEELITPELVVSEIGGFDEEARYTKMSQIFLGQKMASEKVQAQRKTGSGLNVGDFKAIPIAGPSTFDFCLPSTSRNLPITNQYQNAIQQETSSTSRECTDTLKTAPKNSLTLIPPNYTTLLGFRSILLARHMLEAKDGTDSDSEEEEVSPTLTSEGQEAFQLFKDRLITLFKYPVGMSEIPPPMVYEVNVFVDETENSPKRERKRKRVEVEETVEEESLTVTEEEPSTSGILSAKMESLAQSEPEEYFDSSIDEVAENQPTFDESDFKSRINLGMLSGNVPIERS